MLRSRVTEVRWIACSVRDDIAFGLKPGGELKIETSICHEIRQSGQAVIIDNVAEDALYCAHHTPVWVAELHFDAGGRIVLRHAVRHRPRTAPVNTPETIRMFEMFTEIIGYHLSAIDRMQSTEATLLDERNASALREQFIAVLGHDLRNPLAAIDGGLHSVAADAVER